MRVSGQEKLIIFLYVMPYFGRRQFCSFLLLSLFHCTIVFHALSFSSVMIWSWCCVGVVWIWYKIFFLHTFLFIFCFFFLCAVKPFFYLFFIIQNYVCSARVQYTAGININYRYIYVYMCISKYKCMHVQISIYILSVIKVVWINILFWTPSNSLLIFILYRPAKQD